MIKNKKKIKYIIWFFIIATLISGSLFYFDRSNIWYSYKSDTPGTNYNYKYYPGTSYGDSNYGGGTSYYVLGDIGNKNIYDLIGCFGDSGGNTVHIISSSDSSSKGSFLSKSFFINIQDKTTLDPLKIIQTGDFFFNSSGVKLDKYISDYQYLYFASNRNKKTGEIMPNVFLAISAKPTISTGDSLDNFKFLYIDNYLNSDNQYIDKSGDFWLLFNK